MLFKGSGVALITPFNENNSINFDKVNELIEFQIKNNTDAIIICGTTGESATLSLQEKKQLIKYSIEIADSRIPIIAGTGCNDTEKTIELSKYAEEVHADGLLIVTPYYNKCTEEGLYLHYRNIAKEVDLPIIIYNVPSRTNIDISVDTIIKLSKIENICGIKEASPNLSKITQIINSVSDDFLVYSGNDDLIIPIMAIGGAGVISVAANVIPKTIHDVCTHMINNNLKEALNLYTPYFNFIKNLFIEVNPIPIKYVMNKLSYNVGNLRLPLTNLQETNSDILDYDLSRLSLN